jgi:hypothetical protein
MRIADFRSAPLLPEDRRTSVSGELKQLFGDIASGLSMHVMTQRLPAFSG